MARKQTNPEKSKKPFPTALRTLMNERNTTQKDLADHLGKTPQAVSLYCIGESAPDLETLAKIARFFDTSTDYLLGLTTVKSKNRDVIEIIHQTNLSETAATLLCALANASDDTPDYSMIKRLFPSSEVFNTNIDEILQIKSALCTTFISEIIECLVDDPSILDNCNSRYQRNILLTMINDGELDKDARTGMDIITSEEYSGYHIYEITRKIHTCLVSKNNSTMRITKI